MCRVLGSVCPFLSLSRMPALAALVLTLWHLDICPNSVPSDRMGGRGDPDTGPGSSERRDLWDQPPGDMDAPPGVPPHPCLPPGARGLVAVALLHTKGRTALCLGPRGLSRSVKVTPPFEPRFRACGRGTSPHQHWAAEKRPVHSRVPCGGALSAEVGVPPHWVPVAARL